MALTQQQLEEAKRLAGVVKQSSFSPTNDPDTFRQYQDYRTQLSSQLQSNQLLAGAGSEVGARLADIYLGTDEGGTFLPAVQGFGTPQDTQSKYGGLSGLANYLVGGGQVQQTAIPQTINQAGGKEGGYSALTPTQTLQGLPTDIPGGFDITQQGGGFVPTGQSTQQSQTLGVTTPQSNGIEGVYRDNSNNFYVIENGQRRKIELPEFQSLGLNEKFVPAGSVVSLEKAKTDRDGQLPPQLQTLNQGLVMSGQLPAQQAQQQQQQLQQVQQTDDLVNKLLATQMPSEQETQLQKQINDYITSAELGGAEVMNQTIPLGLAIGQAQALESQANAKLAGLQRQLGLLQGNREMQANVLEKAYDIKRNNLQDQLAFFRATAPESLFIDQSSGRAYFRNPVSGQVSYQDLPGFKPKQDFGAGIIGEYQFAQSQGYSGSFSQYQNEDANRKMAIAAQSGQLSSKQISQALQLANSLKSHPAYTDMLDIQTGLQGVLTGLAAENGFGDITAINAFQRMVDPGATVRSEDVVLLQTASGFVDKVLSNYPIEKLREGDKLPQAVRDRMKEVAQNLYQVRSNNYNQSVGNQYKSLSEGAQIPFEFVGQDFEAIKNFSPATSAPTSNEDIFREAEQAGINISTTNEESGFLNTINRFLFGN